MNRTFPRQSVHDVYEHSHQMFLLFFYFIFCIQFYYFAWKKNDYKTTIKWTFFMCTDLSEISTKECLLVVLAIVLDCSDFLQQSYRSSIALILISRCQTAFLWNFFVFFFFENVSSGSLSGFHSLRNLSENTKMEFNAQGTYVPECLNWFRMESLASIWIKNEKKKLFHHNFQLFERKTFISKRSPLLIKSNSFNVHAQEISTVYEYTS